jgi:predicted DNA-binding transcriptional regulator AlpA
MSGGAGYLNEKDAAAFLAVAPSTLAKWRCQGRGPRFARLGRRIAYSRRELEEWAAGRTMPTTERKDRTP